MPRLERKPRQAATGILISPDKAEAIKQLAQKRNISIAALCRNILTEYLDKVEE